MGKVELWTYLLFGSLLIFGLLHMYKCDGADFLGVQQRFNDSTHYDYYYSCNICDGLLGWIIDEAEIVYHLASRTEVGNVESVNSTVNSNSLRYSSLVLSKRFENGQVCLDAVLVFTQNESDLRPEVKCYSNNGNYIAQYQTIPNRLIDVSSLSVTIRNSKNSHRDVVSPGNNWFTQIVVCLTSGDFLRWSNESFSASFNDTSRAGSSQFKKHPLNNNITLLNTVVLEKSKRYTTSIIIWTDYISAGTYHIKCESDTNEVATTINAPSVVLPTTLFPVSTKLSSSTPSVTTSPSSYQPLSCCLTSVAALLVVAMNENKY